MLQKYSISFSGIMTGGAGGGYFNPILYKSYDMNGSMINSASINVNHKIDDNLLWHINGVANFSTNEKVVEFCGLSKY